MRDVSQLVQDIKRQNIFVRTSLLQSCKHSAISKITDKDLNLTDITARETANLATAIMASEVSISAYLTPPHSAAHNEFCTNHFNVQEVPIPERKARKSVAFSEGTSVVDENGVVTMKEDGHDD